MKQWLSEIPWAAWVIIAGAVIAGIWMYIISRDRKK